MPAWISRGARVAVQGFGAVGRHAARFLAEKGAVLVAASDSRGAVVGPGGLDLAAPGRDQGGGPAVSDYPGGRKRSTATRSSTSRARSGSRRRGPT